MRGIETTEQLVNSMYDVLPLLEKAKASGDSAKVLKIKEFLLKMQAGVAKELE
ncbi:hypothetical protein H8D91_02260 [archaeon]|nr:hypothetical protein [archaeon]